MNALYLGELAALGTALCWSFSSIFFTLGGKRVGSIVVNRGRLLAAVILVSLLHLVLLGRPYPQGAGMERWLWFGLSALVGLVLGDTLLFQSYILVGTRIGMLLMSLNPVFGALLAWPLLGETLQPAEVAGMLVALAGAAWVVFERSSAKGGAHADNKQGGQKRAYLIGAALALGAGICQALGLIIAKRGLVDNFSPLSAVVMRMSIATASMWLWALFAGEAGPTVRTLHRDPRAELVILGGALAGPVFGVWLSLIAVQSVRVGIASTLMAMTPILLLPMVRWVYREHVSRRAIAGTLLAVVGVGLMFLF